MTIPAATEEQLLGHEPLPDKFTHRVENCPRCGKSHGVVYTRMQRVNELWTHYGICENTYEPIMLTTRKTLREWVKHETSRGYFDSDNDTGTGKTATTPSPS